MLRYLILILSILLSVNTMAAEEADHAIHEQLRALLHGMEKAVNEQRYNDLAPYFDPHMHVTTINQETISSREGIAKYFNHWFGPGGYLKSVQMKLKADAKTRLYDNNSFGVVWGSGDEDYILSDTRKFNMKTRWTATVIKDPDGKWRILTLHIGTNFLDNPILNKAESSLKYFTIAGFTAGILLMLIIMFLGKRFRKT